MKYINRELKGTWGYIRKQFIFELIKTIILFLMAFGIFAIGYFTLGTKKSLWSVFAVLAMLPACKSLIGVIMLGIYRSLPMEEYEEYKSAVGSLPCLYENVITTSQKSYFVPVIACEDNTVIAYCKPKKPSDIKNLEEHIANVLKNAGHKVATIKIFDSKASFIGRAQQMNSNLGAERKNSTDSIFATIKAVSL